MKNIIFILFLLTSNFLSYSQSADILKKGNTVYVESNSSNDHLKQLKAELVTRLGEWGYWKVADNKDNADFIMEVDAEAERGITMTSWGGVSIMAKVKLNTKSGESLWESDEIKSSPNGTNGFNSANAVSKKIIRALKKKFS